MYPRYGIDAGTLLSQPNLASVMEYIISNFLPSFSFLIPYYKSHTRQARFLSILLVAYWGIPFIIDKIKSLRRIPAILTSSVSINSLDGELYDQVVRWSATQRNYNPSQSLIAFTNAGNTSNAQLRANQGLLDMTDPYGTLPPGARGSRVTPKLKSEVKYRTGLGWQILIFRRRVFFLEEYESRDMHYSGHQSRRGSVLKLYTIGRSRNAIDSLLQHIHKTSRAKETEYCMVYGIGDSGGGYARSSLNRWQLLSARQKRSLDTIVLAENHKSQIVKDLTDYLSSETERWYLERGIPYRRGYLFWGPPGTGKSSMAICLASKFELPIYMISLLNMELNDASLLTLFQCLPKRCIVLLEDVDAAGLDRKSQIRKAQQRPRQHDEWSGLNEYSVLPPTDSFREKSIVSLSGLLNAIDGVMAPEGHILVMTTNKPEDLDEALVRSGRVSVRVGFPKCDKQQSRCTPGTRGLRIAGQSHGLCQVMGLIFSIMHRSDIRLGRRATISGRQGSRARQTYFTIRRYCKKKALSH